MNYQFGGNCFIVEPGHWKEQYYVYKIKSKQIYLTGKKKKRVHISKMRHLQFTIILSGYVSETRRKHECIFCREVLMTEVAG